MFGNKGYEEYGKNGEISPASTLHMQVKVHTKTLCETVVKLAKQDGIPAASQSL